MEIQRFHVREALVAHLAGVSEAFRWLRVPQVDKLFFGSWFALSVVAWLWWRRVVVAVFAPIPIRPLKLALLGIVRLPAVLSRPLFCSWYNDDFRSDALLPLDLAPRLLRNPEVSWFTDSKSFGVVEETRQPVVRHGHFSLVDELQDETEVQVADVGNTDDLASLRVGALFELFL